MLDKTKTDKNMGLAVNEWLVEKKVQTPLSNIETYTDSFNIIKSSFKQIMHALMLDMSDDSLKESPKRYAKMFLNELFWGLNVENFPRIMVIENKMQYDEMVLEKNIQVTSACEHHFATIWGKAHIGYIPHKKVLGLSKLNRIVEYFSRRPQIQERLTEQIYYALQFILETDDIAVVIDAEHFCVKSRGVEDINSNTITSKLGGIFKSKTEVRQEFMGLIK